MMYIIIIIIIMAEMAVDDVMRYCKYYGPLRRMCDDVMIYGPQQNSMDLREA